MHVRTNARPQARQQKRMASVHMQPQLAMSQHAHLVHLTHRIQLGYVVHDCPALGHLHLLRPQYACWCGLPGDLAQLSGGCMQAMQQSPCATSGSTEQADLYTASSAILYRAVALVHTFSMVCSLPQLQVKATCWAQSRILTSF
jgi:hypothetical protein